MQLDRRWRAPFRTLLIVSALLLPGCQSASQLSSGESAGDSQTLSQNAQRETAAAPTQSSAAQRSGLPSRSSTAPGNMTLSQSVMAAISDIQEAMSPPGDIEPDMESAKVLLDELYERRFARMNDFEKQTTLNFYTNYYLANDDYPAAAETFEAILEIENVRPDIRQRTLRSLGQLQSALENWPESIDYYEQWQANASETDSVTLRGLSYAHYQLEQFEEALPYWQAYMQNKREREEEVSRDDYAYLNGLYFTLENWTEALETTQEMILLFNSSTDWDNLRAIYRKLDEQSGVVQPDAA